MKQTIIFLFLLFLIVPLVSAYKDYGEDTYGASLYGQIAEDIVIEEEVAGHIGGSGIGTIKTAEEIEEDARLERCPEYITFLDRIISICKMPDNEICDDGEWLLLDKDCKLDENIFYQMGIIRILLLISLILLIKNNKYFPISVLFVIVLFYLNGALF